MKNRKINVLLLENIHPDAAMIYEDEGINVQTAVGSLDEEELCKQIKDVAVLGIRSKTQVTEKVLDCAEHLLAIGAYCIGTNQINIDACSKRGIIVFNAPYSNTRIVV